MTSPRIPLSLPVLPLRSVCHRLSLLVALVPFLAGSLGLHAEELIAIQAGRVITVSGDEIENGTILIEGGRIRAVGKDIEVPWSARVYKFPKATAMPGLIDCHSTAGLRDPNEIRSDVPYVSVLDGLDPSSATMKNSLRDGVTVAHVIPSNATRFGGQGAVLRMAGETVAEMQIQAPSGMKISLAPPRGQSRMQNMAVLRKKFFDLFVMMRNISTEGEEKKALETRPAEPPGLDALVHAKSEWGSIVWDKIPESKIDIQWRAMVDLVRGKLPAFIYCQRASDVYKAFELMDSNGVKATLILGADAYKLGRILGSRKDLGPVILDRRFVTREVDSDTGEETLHVTPRVLHDAGIRFAVQVSPDSSRRLGPRLSLDGEYHLWYQAARLVSFGIPRAEALKAVTLVPAEILGLAHRMGSLEPGKDANIVVFSGDPLDARSWVELALIEGVEVYRRKTDRDLELLLKDPERPF